MSDPVFDIDDPLLRARQAAYQQRLDQQACYDNYAVAFQTHPGLSCSDLALERKYGGGPW